MPNTEIPTTHTPSINVGKYRKFIAVLVAVVASLGIFAGDGVLTTSEIIALVIEGLTAAGVYTVPNED